MVENTPIAHISQIVEAQRLFFRSHATLDIEYRLRALRTLRSAIKRYESDIMDALYVDLHKSYEEAYLTELSILYGEIDGFLRHLKRWAAPQRRRTPLKLMPSRSRVVVEPLGSALIIAPWNYPVQLLLNPLIGAIAAGCTAILKPSPYTPNVSATLAKLIAEVFPEEYVAVVQGNREVNSALLEQRYDIIFFTGSPDLGRVVMRSAAEHLTPVILELGGKSPVVVDSSADIEVAARRLAWAKSLNAGQTCVAPDYLLIHRDVKDRFIEAWRASVRQLHGEDVAGSKHYVRIVSQRAYERVASYLSDGRVVSGGGTDAAQRYIEPTLLDDVSPDSAVMQSEIFGPVLPMITIDSVDEAVDFILDREKPLALYIFAKRAVARRVLRLTSSGGACINDAIMHVANEHLPFGGVGNSGMGRYHGRESLYAFSHCRGVVTTPTTIDVPFRYMPYRLFRWIKGLL